MPQKYCVPKHYCINNKLGSKEKKHFDTFSVKHYVHTSLNTKVFRQKWLHLMTINDIIHGILATCIQSDHPTCSKPPIDFKPKFRFGLTWPDLARSKRNFCFEVNGRF